MEINLFLDFREFRAHEKHKRDDEVISLSVWMSQKELRLMAHRFI